jgi:hypothetical protein
MHVFATSNRRMFRRHTHQNSFYERRDLSRRLLSGVALGMFALLSTPARAATPLIAGQFQGQAATVEAEALLGSLSVGLANASSESCPCSGTNGGTLSNTVSALSVGPGGTVLSSGVAHSAAYGFKTATTATTKQSSRIAKLNVLNGLITADAITAVASVDVTATALTPSFTGTTFANLFIAGKKIDVGVAENTVIMLPGLGSVTVKFVNTGTYGQQAVGIEVELLRITVTTANSLGLQPGTVVVVGEAYAGYNRQQPAATLGGFAETLAVTANAAAALQEAAAGGALTGISSCSGTNGATLTDTASNLSVAGLLTINTATVTAFGGPSGKANVAQTTSTVNQVSLLGGLITATNIVAAAAESRTGDVSTPSDLGSTFGDLVVAGQTIATNVPPNTVISLAGLGYVVLNEQPPAGKGQVQVNGLHIVVTTSNTLNLPVGVEIFIAHADATARAF